MNDIIYKTFVYIQIQKYKFKPAKVITHPQQQNLVEMNLSQTQQTLIIPQTISSQKLELLIIKLLRTITGISQQLFILTQPNILNIFLFVISVTLFIVFACVQLSYGIQIGVIMGVMLIIAVIFNLWNKQEHTPHHYLFAIAFGYLWAHQLYYANQTQIIVLSLISIIFSIAPVVMYPVPEISSPTLYIKQFSIDSVRYIRLLLPLPLLIVSLVLDYGSFLAKQTKHLYFVRLTISLVFISWSLGWISTIYNVYYYLINNINRFLFGDQSKYTVLRALISLVLNSIPIAIYIFVTWINNSLAPYWILWIGSTLTSIIQQIFMYFQNHPFKTKQTSNRLWLMIVLELIVFGALFLVVILANFNLQAVHIITIIDVALYLLLRFVLWLAVPRNFLGFSININILNHQYVRLGTKIILRTVAGITIIIVVNNLNAFQLWKNIQDNVQFGVDYKFIQYFFIPFLVYRSYKRSLTQSNSFAFHLSVAICLILSYNQKALQGLMCILFLPPFPNNFLLTLLAPFLTPPKLRSSFYAINQIFYTIINFFTLMVYLLSLGTLQLSMVFGLPVFWCVMPCVQENSGVKSKEASLYQKIVDFVPKGLFRYRDNGVYLIRISKYIIVVQIKQQCYGFGQILDFKGLQVQEVTSCHSKQGETIDKMVEENYGHNAQCWNLHHLKTVLSPICKTQIYVPTENDIQLTGIIESKQFLELFKSTLLKALVLQVSYITYSEKQLADGQQLIEDLRPICKQDKFHQIFPLKFAQKVDVRCCYPIQKKISIKKKLPPIPKKALVNDFMDMMLQSPKPIPQQSTHQLNPLQSTTKTQPAQQINPTQLNVALVISLYHYSIGKFDYLNMKRIYDMINREKGEITQVKFQGFQPILAKALAIAFKITIDKTLMAQNQVGLQDFQEYQSNSFLGITGTQDFNQAVKKDISDIWTLNYTKGSLSVKRLAKSQNDLYIFKADTTIVKSVYNNLRFELMYAVNDNDQRYSIQTHPYLMRNLWTQACQEPFGYPSYHSGPLINY